MSEIKKGLSGEEIEERILKLRDEIEKSEAPVANAALLLFAAIEFAATGYVNTVVEDVYEEIQKVDDEIDRHEAKYHKADHEARYSKQAAGDNGDSEEK